MTRTAELRQRISELERETSHSDDSPGELYLKQLRHASDHTDESFPGAAAEWQARFRLHLAREELRKRRRVERFGESGGSP